MAEGVVFPKKGEIVMLMGNEVFFNATITSWVKDIRPWEGRLSWVVLKTLLRGLWA